MAIARAWRQGVAGLAAVAFLGMSAEVLDAALAQAVDEDVVVDTFLGAAFGPPSRRAETRLYRWRDPIRLRLIGQAPQRYRLWAARQAERLSGLTGLTITRVDDIDANFLVAFVPSFDDVIDGAYNDLLARYINDRDAIAAMLEGYRQTGAVCSGQVSALGGVLDEAIIFIPIDRLPPVVHGCIASQMTRVLGLPYAVGIGLPTVLAQESPHSHLTPVDELVLRILYDERLELGMTVEQASEAARRALRAIEAER